MIRTSTSGSSTTRAERLPRALAALARERHGRLRELAAQLRPRLLAGEIQRRQERLAELGARAGRAARNRRERIGERLASFGQRLENLSYRKVLARGYAVARDAGGRPLGSVALATPGSALGLEFHDGEVGVTVEGTPSRPARRPRKPGGNQGELF